MRRMAEHDNGILLTPAATETEAFTKYVWGAAKAVLFLRGRPHFHYVDGTRASANCGTAIVLAAYGIENRECLAQCGLPGRYVRLK